MGKWRAFDGSAYSPILKPIRGSLVLLTVCPSTWKGSSMNAVLLALAIVSSATPPVPASTAFIEALDAKWIPITLTNVQTLSGQPAFMRAKLTRSVYCSLKTISDSAQCITLWNHISHRESIAPDEIQITDGRGFIARFSQEHYCAFTLISQPYTLEDCRAVWNTILKQFPGGGKIAD